MSEFFFGEFLHTAFDVDKHTWKTVFRRGLFAACSLPMSWHHLKENKPVAQMDKGILCQATISK
jgi:hypothetical protein